MASFSFQSKDFIGYPYPDPNYNHLIMDYRLPVPAPDFELSDYLVVPEAGSEEDSTATNIGIGCDHQSQNPILLEKASYDHHQSQNPILLEKPSHNLIGDSGNVSTSSYMQVMDTQECMSGVKRIKVDVDLRVAFRTKSELEIMDDGFKWRKYGKKSVKNSPNPRNYFKCASGGCNVKKRVERDREDSSYVITTYEGIHNHESPCVVYYDQVPLMVPSGWKLQASHSYS